MPRILEQLSDS